VKLKLPLWLHRNIGDNITECLGKLVPHCWKCINIFFFNFSSFSFFFLLYWLYWETNTYRTIPAYKYIIYILFYPVFPLSLKHEWLISCITYRYIYIYNFVHYTAAVLEWNRGMITIIEYIDNKGCIAYPSYRILL